MRIVYRYMVRFQKFTADLLADNLNPLCADCSEPATSLDRKYMEWVCAEHRQESR